MLGLTGTFLSAAHVIKDTTVMGLKLLAHYTNALFYVSLFLRPLPLYTTS
jgi:hypothetical protein